MKRFAPLAILTAVVLLCAPAVHANTITYTATLSGFNESPANASLGLGSAVVIFDDTAKTMEVQVTFSGLTGTTTASHIHCCTAVAGAGTAGVATMLPTFVGFPLGVTAGTYDHTFDMTLTGSYNGSFVTANGGTASTAEAALLAGIDADKAYLNIHSSAFGGGEIRGFLQPVPEPTSLLLLGTGIVGATARRWRKRRG